MATPDLETMIDRLVEQMEDWSGDALLDWAQEARRNMLAGVDEATVREEYEFEFPEERED